MRPMRRTDRQVADEAGIRAILDRCQICRLALWDEEGPYIVPMSYGYRWDEGGLKLYFHCAGEGRKLDALRHTAARGCDQSAFDQHSGEHIRAQRTRIVRRNGDKLLCQRRELVDHLRDVLVRHDADEKRNLAVREMLREAFRNSGDALWVVPAVCDEDRVLPKKLKSRRPADAK